MVYLEKEVATLGGKNSFENSPNDEFLHSADYTDELFDIDFQGQESDENLEVLLGVQNWRKNSFTSKYPNYLQN